MFSFFNRRDTLQDRMLFRAGYEYAPGQFEYITFGADKMYRNSIVINITAAQIFRKKYSKSFSLRQIIVL